MLFSATVPKWVKKLVKQYLNSECGLQLALQWLQFLMWGMARLGAVRGYLVLAGAAPAFNYQPSSQQAC